MRESGGGVVVMTHGYSRVVLAVLVKAQAQGKRFSVVVPEGRVPGAAHKSGYEVAQGRARASCFVAGRVLLLSFCILRSIMPRRVARRVSRLRD